MTLSNRASSILASVILLAAAAAAQDVKLNGPLARPIGGDIRVVEVSPDGKRVAYVADQDIDEVLELFVTRLDLPGAPLKLAGPSVAGGDVSPNALWMGPRSKRVVFVGDLETDDQFEIYSVLLHGRAPVRLNGPMHPLDDVFTSPESVQIDPGETRVVWLQSADGDRDIELFSAPIAGGPAVRLNVPTIGAGSAARVADFRITPDGSRVVYRAKRDWQELETLYVVPIGGGTPVRLNPAGTFVDEGYEFDAAGLHVVFAVSADRREPAQLYAAALDNSGPAQPLLTAQVVRPGELVAVPGSASMLCALPAGLAVVPLDGSGERVVHVLPAGRYYAAYRPTPDGERALFSVTIPGVGGLLRSVLLDGSAPSTLIDVGGGFEISADGTRVVYGKRDVLRSALVDGSGGRIDIAPAGSFDLTPDGERVVFLAYRGASAQLGSAPVLGGAPPVRLNGPLPYGGNVQSLVGSLPFRIGARGDVVYVADEREDGRYELFSVPVAGGTTPVVLNDPMPIGPVEGDVSTFQTSADGERAVYIADEVVDHRPELVSVRTDGSSGRVHLNEPLAEGEGVFAFVIAPDAQRVVYRLDRQVERTQELRVVPIDGGAPAVLAGIQEAVGNTSLTVPRIDPTSTRGVFVRSVLGVTTTESVLLDGSALPIVLAAGPLGTESVFSPDGTRILSLVEVGGVNPPLRRLRSLPIDGSAPGVFLDSGGTVRALLLSPDGTRALFEADSLTPGQFEAFSAPLDGSAPALRLNPPLALPQADVSRLQASGDFAFYLASDGSGTQLWRVPLDGSATAVKLNGPLGPDGSVRRFLVTADGTRAVYVAGFERYELFSVTTDLSEAPRKLNAPLTGSDTVGGNYRREEPLMFALDPSGAQVAFLVVDSLASVFDSSKLFVAPVDGSAPARYVADPTSSFDYIFYEFSPDGRSLAVRTVPVVGYELRLASARGLHPARLISGPSIERPLFRWASGNALVYQHDAETPTVVELFLHRVRRLATQDAPTRTLIR